MSRLGRRLPLKSESGQRRHRPDYLLVLFVVLLMFLGLVVIYAIGPQRANILNSVYGTDYDSNYFVIKQATSLTAALVSFIAFAYMPIAWLKKHAKTLLLAGFAASALLFLAGNLLDLEQVAQCSLGACRWFNLGPFGSLQPAELLKFGLLIFIASFLGMRMQQGQVNNVEKTIIPLAITVGIALFFTIVMQKDMGTGIAITSLAASMLMVSGVSKSIGVKLLLVVLALGVVLIIAAPHRIERVVTFIKGDQALVDENDDSTHHIRQAMLAIGSGGFFGLGIGNSVQAAGRLPESINDSVFAIMGETFGFVGLLSIITIFTGLLMRILKITDRLNEPWMKLLAAGVFGWVSAHVVLNIASMIGVFPLTGITLPLLSFGGTSMVFIAAALGIVFQLSRFTEHKTSREEMPNANLGSRRGIGRTRYASRRGNS